MDLMSSSALSSLETKAMTIWTLRAIATREKSPKVGAHMTDAFYFLPKNSVGDIIDMFMQMLEVSFTYVISLHILIHLLKGAWIYSLLEYCPSSEYPIQLMFKRKIQLPLWFLQDAFKDIFVIQWHPESLRTMKVSISRPRVYLINFETTVQFPTGCPLTERVSVGCLVAGEYFRPRAPELDSGKAYSPFKLDV